MRQPLTREAISAAARDILVAEGLHAVSLRRVAASLGVTAPALYAHVADKRDLLQGIAEQELERLMESVRALDSHDPVERIRQQCLLYIDYAVANPDLFRAMFLFRPELTAEARGDRPPLATRLLRMMTEPVREAYESGGFAAGNTPELAGLTIWTAAHGAATMLVSGPPVDIELQARLAEAVVEAVLGGLRHGAAVRAA
jgi:AcrR family transcriptional regulator